MDHAEAQTAATALIAGTRDLSPIKLQEMLDCEPGIQSASLSTVDGRSISFVGEPYKGQAHRMGAISSSFLALSEAFTKEARIGGTQHTAVAGDSGTLITVRVPSRSREFVLSLCADPSINMAMALRFALDASERIAKAIDQAQR
jgi:predicted regulator of Ras-like GTPase activity (Roadblock/LC7/MglB family)